MSRWRLWVGFTVPLIAAAASAGLDARAQNTGSQRPYRVNAGRTSLRQEKGERVLLMEEGVTIERGDVLVRSERGRHYDRQKITYLYDNVTIDQNELHMEADEGEYRQPQDLAILRRNVHIVDRGWDITCNEAAYFRGTEIAWLHGNVVVRDSVTTLTADSLRYDKLGLIAEAFGNVFIANEEEGVQAQGKHGFYYRKAGMGIIDRDPVLTVDPDSEEPAVVVSDTMVFFPETESARAYGRVKVVKGDMVTQADSAVVLDAEKRAELYGNPLSQQNNLSMKSDRMAFAYDEEEIRQIALVGSALMVETPRDTLVRDRDSWVAGDSIVLYLRENRLDSIRVVGQAKSEYYPRSPDKVESNTASGDEMFFIFRKDSLAYVKMVGAADGIYRFLNLGRDETADSLRAVHDTSLKFVSFREEADEVVYSADTIQYFARKRDLVLNSKSRVLYRNRTLVAADITYNADIQLLDARGDPILIEGQDKMYGGQMNYDLEEGIGLVQEGSTKFIAGFYRGEEVAKVDEKTLKMWNSTYTTCDRKDPHYHITSKEMKVYLDDKVVTGPLVLYVGDTPIGLLPFFAQDIHQGRRSGILRPDFEFGVNTSAGRFIRNVGYYWATNDYTDFTFVADFNETESFRVLTENRYRRRYSFSGGVRYTFLRNLQNFTTQWTLAADHAQPNLFGPKSRLTGQLRFVSSDEALKEVSRIDNVEDLVNRQIQSRVALSKSWDAVSVSTSLSRDEFLNVTDPQATKVSMTLPNVTLSIPSRSLWFGGRAREGRESLWQKLLDNIRYSPNVSANRQTRERLMDQTETITADASLSFSSPVKIGFVNVSPTLQMSDNYRRTVTDEDARIETSTNVIQFGQFTYELPETTFVPAMRTVEEENQFNWSTGAAASFNLYGTFYPEVGSLRGVRHTFRPTTSYSFRPGTQGRPSTQGFSVGLDNSIDVKLADGDKERKIPGLVQWSLGSSYNPDAASRRGWSNIRSNVNFGLIGARFSVNQTIEPYQWDVLNTSITVSGFELRGRQGFGASEERQFELNTVATELEADSAAADAKLDSLPAEASEERDRKRDSGEGLPWSLGASFSYNRSSFGDARSTLNILGDMNLTRGWQLKYSTQYDVQNKDFVGHRFELARNLHCWEMSFVRAQVGDEWEFYFRISLIAHPELYAEEGERGLGGSRSFSTPFNF